MPSLFNRLKTWAFQEVVKSKDLNAEFDNIINHMSALFVGGFSETLAQFETQTNPGTLASPNLPDSVAGEIAELRFVLAEITGNQYWFEAPAASIAELLSLIKLSANVPNNRIIAGKLRSTSNQPIFLHANGSTPQVILEAATVNFQVEIQNVAYTFLADTPLTLPTAPGSGNAATLALGLLVTAVSDVNGNLASKYFLLNTVTTGYYVWFIVSGTGTDPAVGGRTGIPVNLTINGTAAQNAAAIYSAIQQQIGAALYLQVSGAAVSVFSALSSVDGNSGFTFANLATPAASLFAGESDWNPSQIVLNLSGAGSGTAIAALVGQYAAFQVVDGGNTEYFMGYVSAASGGAYATLTNCFRGYFFDSSDNPVQATLLTNGDAVTLLRLNYIYATTSLSTFSSQSPPIYSSVAPTSPSLGDMWFDLTTQIWMQYGSSGFVNSNATLIGLAVTNTTNCIASRSFEIFAPYNAKNTAQLAYSSTTDITSAAIGDTISVAGNTYVWAENFMQFLVPSDYADSDAASFAPSTQYYLYVSDLGAEVVSSIRPLNRKTDLFGYYHRYSPWRCVGQVLTDGASHFIASSLTDLSLPAAPTPYSLSQQITSSCTVVAPLWATNAIITGRAGSGGGASGAPGAGGTGGGGGGGGGGAGTLSRTLTVPVVGGTSYAVTIGEAGLGGLPGAFGGLGNAGGAGGNTSFDSLVTFLGGNGGAAPTSSHAVVGFGALGRFGQNNGGNGASGGSGIASTNGLYSELANGGVGGSSPAGTNQGGGGGGGSAGDGVGGAGGNGSTGLAGGFSGSPGVNGGGGGGGGGDSNANIGVAGTGGSGSDGYLNIVWTQ